MFRKIGLVMLLLALMFFTRLGVRGQVVGTPYRLSDKDVEQIIHRIENQADTFRHNLDSALDKSRFNGTEREDNINEFVKQFDKETRRLHDHFDHHKSTAADVQTVLDRASWIDRFMRRHPLTDQAQNDWSNLRASLDELATAYNVTWGWEPAFSSTPTGLPYRLSDKEVGQILRRIERQADRFRKSWTARSTAVV